MIAEEKINIENINSLVDRHKAFIIQTVSNITGRYISIQNDDEYSIALSAFAEAVERFDQKRGNFLSFARLVIESRVKTHLEKVNKYSNEVSLEYLQENGQDFEAPQVESSDDLREEIIMFQKELKIFGLSLEILADEAPKHKDTRKTAIQTAEKASSEKRIVDLTYKKRRLPIREVADHCKVTEKIVKRSKYFILATMLIFVKGFSNLIYWIKGSRCSDVR